MKAEQEILEVLTQINETLTNMQDKTASMNDLYTKFLQDLFKQAGEIIPKLEKDMQEIRMRLVILENKH